MTYNFDTDPTQGANAIKVYQTGFTDSTGTSIYWKATGGNPDTGGFLGVTWPIGSSSSIVVFPDIDQGKIVTAFKLEADLRVGNPQQNERAADGFSVNFARANDPVLQNDPPTPSDFATSGAVETGTTTGLAILFDTWSGNALPDTSDIEGIIVRVDNVTVGKFPMPTRNGACADATSLQTGPRDLQYWQNNPVGATGNDSAFASQSWSNLCWQKVVVEVDDQSQVTVSWKGTTLLDKVKVNFFPSAGGIVLAGRTGGADEHTHFDNLTLTTTASAADTTPPTVPGPVTVVGDPGAYRLTLTWAASTDDSGRVGYELEQNGTQLPGAYASNTNTLGNLKASTAYQFRVRATDVSGNKSAWTAVTTITTAADVADPIFAGAKIYEPISGTAVATLLADPSYPDSPARVGRLNNMWMSYGDPNFGETFGDNLGVRIAGTITPTVTGQYNFFVRSDDASQLYINTTGASIPVADDSSYVCTETGCCNPFREPGPDQPYATTTTPISLTAGQTYGILFLVKEGGGGDWGQVAWRLVGDNTPATLLPPISAPAFQSEVVPRSDPVGAVLNITEQPQSASVPANTPVTFSVTADVSSPYVGTNAVYQWFKNGTPIAGATARTYGYAFVPASENGAKLKVRVAIPGKNVMSDEVTLTVTADTTAPTVKSGGQTDDTFTKLSVVYSEPLTAAGTYTLNNGATVSGTPTLSADGLSVSLTTSKLTEDTAYALSISGATDRSGNVVAAGTQLNFNSWLVVSNRAILQIYDNISGTAVQALKDDPKFPNSPDRTFFHGGLSYGESSNFGDTYGDNYGAMMKAWVIPTETAQYNFFVRSDDASQLFVGANEAFPDPKTATPVAEETGCCNPFQEPGTASQTTATPISLTAGQRYGVVYLVKEGGGGDWGQVAWRKVGDTTPAASLPPITANAWYYGPKAVAVEVVMAATKNADGSITVTWNGGGTLEVTPSLTAPVTWQAVPGATSPYTFTPTESVLFGRVRNP